VSVVSPDFPVVSISPIIASVNPASKVKLSGMVTVHQDAFAIWYVDDLAVNLSTRALTPLTVALIASQGAQSVINLSLKPNSLYQRSTYTFTLKVSTLAGSLTSKASVAVSTNGPPMPGAFTVTPRIGIAIQQSFMFRATNWVDDLDSFPISYSFGFVSQQGNLMTLQSRSEASYGNASLPFASSPSQSQTVVNTNAALANTYVALSNSSRAYVACVLQVFDTLNANATVYTTVTVTPPKLSQNNLQKSITNQLLAR